MERIRVAGIIKMNQGYAFMHRTNVRKRQDFQDYYTFVGGGLEEGETLEEGVKREIKEELGIEVEVIKKLYELKSDRFNQKEYFYLCKYKNGEFGTGVGPEFSNNPKYIDSGNYIPVILKEEEIEDVFLLPNEIKEMFIKDLKRGNL